MTIDHEYRRLLLAEARCRELVQALNEIKAHCCYALDRSGQRTRPALLVPSAAKRFEEIIDPVLAQPWVQALLKD